MSVIPWLFNLPNIDADGCVCVGSKKYPIRSVGLVGVVGSVVLPVLPGVSLVPVVPVLLEGVSSILVDLSISISLFKKFSMYSHIVIYYQLHDYYYKKLEKIV